MPLHRVPLRHRFYRTSTVRGLMALAAFAAGSSHVHAGRPLTVDDAGVNAPGEGHIEMWWEGVHQERGAVFAAPAYAPRALPGLEVGALLARDLHGRATLNGLQAKWQWTAPRDGGCHAASSAGLVHAHGENGSTLALTAIGTCAIGWGRCTRISAPCGHPRNTGAPPGASRWNRPGAPSRRTSRRSASATAHPPTRPEPCGNGRPAGSSTASWGAARGEPC